MAYKKKEKKSLLLYYDYMEQFELLDDSQFRKLIYAMIDYDKTGNEPKLDKLTKIAFISIKQRLARDKQMWEEMCKKNSENIKKRWEKKDTTVYDGIRANTTVYQSIPKYTKNTDIDNDNDIDIEIDNDNEIECVNNIITHAPISLSDLIEYGEEIGVNVEYCEKFYNTYESTGWINKNGQKITNAKSLLKKWMNEDKKKQQENKIDELEEYIDEAGFEYKNGRRVL